ncbi:MAG UNVERIFIED_CONTAM: carbohydrate porin [Microcystis novacekii LVE1205-3]
MGKEGNLGGLVVGAEPYREILSPNDLSLHLEAFYKYQLTKNISITPGVIWITVA